MLNKTSDYSIFKFRNDNRERIDPSHVDRLAKSIQLKNLLHMRPILVNSDMEVIDGQNRLKAAEKLGVEIYYEVQHTLTAEDIKHLNVSKAWNLPDFHNWYIKNGFIEYQKLDNFMKKNQLQLTVALMLFQSLDGFKMSDFKDGNFKFNPSVDEGAVDYCWETIGVLRKRHGICVWADARKFWKAMIKLFTHPDFKIDVWRKNRDLKAEHISQRATTNDYVRMLENVYNYKLRDKLQLVTTNKELDEQMQLELV